MWCVSFSSSHKKTSKLSNIILHQFEGLHKLWDTPLKFDIIRLSGTTDEYGQLWVGAPNIELDKVTYIDCLTSTFSRSIAPYGIINLESIENDGLKFRLIATNNSTFNNYSIDKNVFVVYKY